MKSKVLTHKGTIPISFKEGRSKPFRLRTTIGGKRSEQYFTTRKEAEAEWARIGRLAGHPGVPVLPPVERSLVTDQEAAQHINMRGRLAAVGLTIEEAIKLAITHKDQVAEKEAPSAQTVVTEFLATYKVRVVKPTANYLKNLKWSLDFWLEDFGKDRKIATIRKGYEVTFAQWANSHDYKPDTVLMLFKSVRALLSYAHEQEYITANPLKSKVMRKRGLLPAPRVNQGNTITVPQMQALLAIFELHYPSRLKSIAMQAFIGFRENQTERLYDNFLKPHLKAFDLPPGIIRKARDGSVGDYIDQLPDNLIEWLTCAAANAKPPVCAGRKWKVGKGQWLPIGRCMWRRIIGRMATLPEPYRMKGWPTNACRHTAATAAYSYFGVARACEMLGWVDQDMLKNQYAGKRWPTEVARGYYEIRPGVAELISKDNPQLKYALRAPLFPNGKGPNGWTKLPVAA